MTQQKAFLGRLGKLGSQAFVSLTSMKQELEAVGAEKLERLARKLQLVRRDEFEDVQAQLRQLQKEHQNLLARFRDGAAPSAGKGKKTASRGKSSSGAKRQRGG